MPKMTPSAVTDVRGLRPGATPEEVMAHALWDPPSEKELLEFALQQFPRGNLSDHKA